VYQLASSPHWFASHQLVHRRNQLVACTVAAGPVAGFAAAAGYTVAVALVDNRRPAVAAGCTQPVAVAVVVVQVVVRNRTTVVALAVAVVDRHRNQVAHRPEKSAYSIPSGIL